MLIALTVILIAAFYFSGTAAKQKHKFEKNELEKKINKLECEITVLTSRLDLSEQDKTSVQKQLEWCIQEKNALREKLDFLSLVADRETESPPTLEKLQLPETALQKKQEESQEDVAQLTQKDCDAREDNMSDITVAETSLVQNKSAHTYTEIQAKHSRGKMPPQCREFRSGKSTEKNRARRFGRDKK